MRRPFELNVAIVEGHLIILLADPLANLPGGNDKLGTHRQRRDLHLAGEVQIEHQAESFRDRAPDRQQSVIAQDHAAIAAQIANDALAFVEIESNAFIVVNSETAIELQRNLADRQQAVLYGRDRHARPRMSVNDAGRVMPRRVNGAVDRETRRVHAMGTVADLPAVEVDLHQRGSGDLLPTRAVRVDEKVTGLAR